MTAACGAGPARALSPSRVAVGRALVAAGRERVATGRARVAAGFMFTFTFTIHRT